MNLNYRILRFCVKRRQIAKRKELNKAMTNLSVEQTMTFNLVKDLAITNNSAIKFDEKTSEILIDLPHILIIIYGNKVYVQNTVGFHTEEFHSDTIDFLRKIIVREAHRDRCKLKHEGKIRIRSLLNNIGHESQEPCSETEDINELMN